MSEAEAEANPMEASKVIASLAAMVFWATGVTLMDPRIGLGIILCIISIGCTVWIFWTAIRQIKLWKVQTWPKMALFLLAIQIAVPLYILLKDGVAHGTRSTPAPPSAPTMVVSG